MTEQLLPIRPLDLMLNEDLTKVEFNDFIGVWENFMPESQCKKFIDWYNTFGGVASVKSNFDETPGDGRFQFPNRALGRSDKQILVNHNNHELAQSCNQHIHSCLEHYLFQYGQLAGQDMMSTCIKFQHTPAGGGYHQWHYEAMGLDHSARVLVWAIYLNEDFEGGETEFLDQKRRIKPTTGTVVFWPAGFTHTHKGNTVLSGDKYILTGWYLLNN